MARFPKFFMVLSTVGVFLLPESPLLAQEWQPVRGGMAYGISGIATVEQGKEAVKLLIVHDNKKSDPGRFAIITIAGNVQPQYTC